MTAMIAFIWLFSDDNALSCVRLRTDRRGRAHCRRLCFSFTSRQQTLLYCVCSHSLLHLFLKRSLADVMRHRQMQTSHFHNTQSLPRILSRQPKESDSTRQRPRRAALLKTLELIPHPRTSQHSHPNKYFRRRIKIRRLTRVRGYRTSKTCSQIMSTSQLARPDDDWCDRAKPRSEGRRRK